MATKIYVELFPQLGHAYDTDHCIKVCHCLLVFQSLLYGSIRVSQRKKPEAGVASFSVGVGDQ